MCVCVVHVSPWRGKEGTRSPGIEAMNCRVSCWESNLGLIEEGQALLTTEHLLVLQDAQFIPDICSEKFSLFILFLFYV